MYGKKNSKCFWSNYLVRALRFFFFFLDEAKTSRVIFGTCSFTYYFYISFQASYLFSVADLLILDFEVWLLFWILSFLPLFLFIHRCNYPIRPKLNLRKRSFPWYFPLFILTSTLWIDIFLLFSVLCFLCSGNSQESQLQFQNPLWIASPTVNDISSPEWYACHKSIWCRRFDN